jgi:peptide/nickel transport system substrate-binding protein
MQHQHEQPVARRTLSAFGVLAWLIVLTGTARCRQEPGPHASGENTALRVGIGGLPLQAPQAGLGVVFSNLSVEGLVNLTEDGRPKAWLAESWATTPDGLSLTVQLRRQAKFHDGTPVNATTVVPMLRESLPKAMGSAFEDIDQILSLGESQIRFVLRRPAPFLIEALETAIQKPGKDGAGTGAFIRATSEGAFELKANNTYYLGRPTIDRILVTPYPSVRSAWAELLRGNLDMLYEVNADALDSLQSSSEVAVFSFVRHYQYMIIFSPRAAVFKNAEVRRGLNAVIDRDALVRDGFNGHGIPSSGPIPPRHWALSANAPKIRFDGKLAAALPDHYLRFTCLVPADSVYERVALAVKRQLATASVDMQVQEVPQDQILKAAAENHFDAILVDAISGPSLFRSYRRWHSGGGSTTRTIESPVIDAALDRIRHAGSDDEYRQGVSAFQQAVVDEPPAIFLVWGERARAVSRRFDVPVPEDGRDVLATLRMWRPATEKRVASN